MFAHMRVLSSMQNRWKAGPFTLNRSFSINDDNEGCTDTDCRRSQRLGSFAGPVQLRMGRAMAGENRGVTQTFIGLLVNRDVNSWRSKTDALMLLVG